MVVEILVLRLFFPAKTSVDLPWEEVRGKAGAWDTTPFEEKRGLAPFYEGRAKNQAGANLH